MVRDIFDKDIHIETDRLKLRPLTMSDTWDIFEIFSDKQVMKYYDLLPFESFERAKEQVEFFIKGFEQKTMLRWGIELKDSGKLIGTCGFFNFNEDALKAELGYELNSSYHGKGLMSEALDAVLEFIFRETDINRVEAFAEPPNIASQKVLKKLGFVKEGTLRRYERCRGELIDIIIYGLLRTDRE
ncbi:GNAT family protein [Ruminococcus sp. FC2018]|uniref:GNAT family N-acetyltransferase n=1 Tax=Ruminococcus sp. FC2018 TaxID=1410617 RepID=UPI000491E472|nr:GNAT family protein [Ruminococcus sp. FC2018]